MERFVIGTGRCGSTMLSHILARHPDVLMLSEFLGALDRLHHLKSGIVSKGEFTNILHENIPLIDICARRGILCKEALQDAGTIQSKATPGMLVGALPFLTDKPDELFAELIDYVDGFPDQTMADHYRMIFAWLQDKFGKTCFIERTGDSITYIDKLYRSFPDAKFLHIHRNGPETVLSMRGHTYFAAVVSFLSDPPSRAELEQTEFGGKPVTMDDPISRRMFANPPTNEQFAAYWNFQMLEGYKTFAKMGSAQYKEIRFEDLLAEPWKIVKEISDFFELPGDDAWIDHAVELVDQSIISSSVAQLAKSQQVALTEACIPGQILTGRYETPWISETWKMMVEMSRAPQSGTLFPSKT